jgi:transcriptional regulator with XRE-family HTH domain
MSERHNRAMPEEETFATWLSRAMRARHMSQRTLAGRSGIDHSTISRIAAGGRSPTLRTAERLREALEGPVRARPAPAQVEMALALDDALASEDVREVMGVYLALRGRGSAPLTRVS